ncbi:MAG: hypothetical protein ACK5LJ_08100 [Paracoccus sp. (in: a-proteobacteria)]
MAKCRTECTVPTMGMGTQGKDAKLFISATDPIEGCVNIRTDMYTSISSDLGDVSTYFNKLARPADQLNCPAPLCNTSGTLYFGFLMEEGIPADPDAEPPVEGTDDVFGTTTVSFHTDAAARDYAAGVINYYLVFNEAGTYEVNTKINSSCTVVPNSVEFNSTVVLGEEELFPKEVLVQYAIDEASNFLPSTDCGMDIEVAVTPTDATTAGSTVGISTLSMVDDREAFEQNETIIMTCVDEIDLPMESELTDPTCLGQAVDDTSVAPELSITAQLVTGNFFKLNPLLHKKDVTTTFDVECMTQPIEEVTVNGTTLYGIRLPNYHAEECSFLSAYLPACNATEGMLKYSSLTTLSEPEFDTFKLATDSETGETYLYFSPDYEGYEATITYPITREATIYEANTDFDEGRRIRVMIPFRYTNGYHGYIISESAYFTSFPFGWSSTENTPMEFTVSFKRSGDKFFDVVLMEDDVLTQKAEW